MSLCAVQTRLVHSPLTQNIFPEFSEKHCAPLVIPEFNLTEFVDSTTLVSNHKLQQRFLLLGLRPYLMELYATSVSTQKLSSRFFSNGTEFN